VFILRLLDHAASTKMKLATGFVHMLINVEILVLSCALRLSLFCVFFFFCDCLKACGVSKTFKNIMSDRRNLLLLTLNYTVALPGLAIFNYKAIL